MLSTTVNSVITVFLEQKSKASRYLQIVAGEPSCILWRKRDTEIKEARPCFVEVLPARMTSLYLPGLLLLKE